MKKKGEELNEFSKLLSQKINEKENIQTHWVIVQEINWDDKTMTAKSVVDGLAFFDVLLGLGAVYTKPVVNTKCLIGIVNNSAAGFLIQAERVDEIQFNTKNSQLHVNDSGFLIKNKGETLKNVLNDLITEINKIVVIQGTSINVPAVTKIKDRLNTLLTQ